MIIYVTFNPKSVNNLKEIQKKDLDNTYIASNDIFAHLDDTFDIEMVLNMRSDVMMACDKLLVIGDIDEIMKKEIAYAELFSMEVEYREAPHS